ncbi:hypothetical protein IG193_04035 [Infirmifilum lucidum]|uniref:DUF3194 domain-containing protein n=1 Tax=Infirmifilum lucidum TaxID=2776706 RepID=A0A7L9FJ11_9CREN|nr:hypothetical protein [Infirmifilum lucidum]QOJ79631.1 hypothetical protein IG193_04035 [Infirmifilum lucidum]
MSRPYFDGVVDLVLQYILKRVEEELPHDPSLQVAVSISMGEDWPYEFSIEVQLDSRVYDRERLEKTVNKIIEEAVKIAEKALREKGLAPLP